MLEDRSENVATQLGVGDLVESVHQHQPAGSLDAANEQAGIGVLPQTTPETATGRVRKYGAP